ncbi:Predicted EndoIII-related endonuclease [Ruminococcus sp. SR1/5]|nr:Predicted EndoIII-related endonuclease [Ruminococcus sp. SR1/5]
MTTQELAYEVISRLKKEYPDADCTLDYDDAWKLLVSVRLAAQCTDARVNVVVQDLYAKYPDVAALAAAEPEAIEAIVRPCGLGKSKARDISACMRILHEQYHDKVPEDFNALLKLPGVGRKKRKPDHGGRIRQACHCNRYSLYPPFQPHRPCP